jgi:regulation of enolase protein 1 (concanavalin A-like superfamily)
MGRAVTAVIETLEGRALMSAVPAVTPGSSLLVFNSVASGNAGASASKVDLLTLTDTGSAPLALGNLSIVNDPASPTQDASAFSVVSVAPAAVAPGASTTLSLQYTASLVGIQSAFLQIQTNDPANPVLSIPLHGIGTAGTGGGFEPSLAEILREFDIPTIVGDGPNDSNAFLSTYYPAVPDPSSQQVSMQRLMKAGTGPVSIQLLASFDVNNNPAARFGYYTPGDPNDRTELFSIGQSDSQTVNPTALGATSFDPGTSTFGLYGNFPTFTDNGHQRISYSENALNTWDTKVPQKVRFFPLENADGTIVPNAYIFAVEDNNIPYGNIQPYDSNDIVGIIRNVKPAIGATNAPVLGLENLSGVPSTTQLVFNRIQNPNPADPSTFVDQVHDTNTIEILNTGDQPLQINSLTLSDTVNWMIVNPPAPGTTVAVGGSLLITVKFIAQTVPAVPYNETNDSVPTNGLLPTQAGGVWTGSLAINSNDPANPTRVIKLAGYWQDMSENENEPGLQTITNLVYGYGTVIDTAQKVQYSNYGTEPIYVGEEVASGLWNSANGTLPVTVTQLASFHNQYANPTTLTAASFGYYKAGSSATTWLFTDQTGNGQTLLPTIKGSTTKIAGGSFNPTGSFGLNLDGEMSQDALNTTDISLGRSGHAVRFFPLRDSTGNIVPNTYLVVMDYEGGAYDNSDFQDNMYIVTNIRPAAEPATPTDLQVFNTGNSVELEWAPVVDPTLQGYNVYRASSPSGPWTKINNGAFSATSFTDYDPGTGTVYYRVAALDGIEGVGATGSIVPILSSAATDVLTSTDVNTGLSGSTNVIAPGQSYAITAAGGDIGGSNADGYRYAYESITGDFDVQVQVSSLQAVQSGTRAGIMIRTSNDPGAQMVFVGATASGGYRFNYRTTAGAVGTYVSYGTLTFPNAWVRLVRAGNVFTGYYSTDGINWIKMQSLTLPISTTIDLGLAVCSHTTTQTATAVFNSFNMNAATVTVPPTNPTPTDPTSGGTPTDPTGTTPTSGGTPTSGTTPTTGSTDPTGTDPGGNTGTDPGSTITMTPAQLVTVDRSALTLAIKTRAGKLKAARALVAANAKHAAAELRALELAKRGHKTLDASLAADVATSRSLLAMAKSALTSLLKTDFTGITVARHALAAAIKALAVSKRKK